MNGPEYTPVYSLTTTVREFLEYIDATGETGYVDTGIVLDYAEQMRSALDQQEHES